MPGALLDALEENWLLQSTLDISNTDISNCPSVTKNIVLTMFFLFYILTYIIENY